MLTINIIEKKYGKTVVLKDFHCKIIRNGKYGIVGKNGSGKTTLFQCICHLTNFNGQINFNDLRLLPKEVAFIPTEPYLYEYLSVREFYSFYAKLTKTNFNKNFIFDIRNDLLIRELSTGMRKKVFINAVLKTHYKIYIFDEPFNGLDVESVIQLREIIDDLAQNHIVFVASHILETLSQCEKIFLINKNNSHEEFDSFDLKDIETKLLNS